MGTPAIVTFKAHPGSKQEDVHLRIFSDGYPVGVANKIDDLGTVASRIWAGEDVDFESLSLPNVDTVALTGRPEESCWAPFRYEVTEIDGKRNITAFRHDVQIPQTLEERLQAARATLEAVEAEMFAARTAPTYSKLTSGTEEDIRKLGDGYEEDE